MNENDRQDELEAQIRAALARKRPQQPARPASPPPTIVAAGMVNPAPAGQPAAAPRPATAAQPAPRQPTAARPAPTPQPSAPPPSAGGLRLDPSERLASPPSPQPAPQPADQLRSRFATPEGAPVPPPATPPMRPQPSMTPAAAAGALGDDGRRALGALLARSAVQQPGAGETQIPPPPGQVLGRIGVEQQPAAAPKEKPFRHPFFRGKRHLWPMLIIPAVSIGVVLVLFYFLIWELGGEGVVDIAPLIEAEETPLKIRPDEEGGLEIPNQEMEIYSEIDGENPTAAEQLVPAPEQPVVPEAVEPAAPAGETVPVVAAPTLEPGADAAAQTEVTTEPAATEPAATDAAATEPAATEATAATETEATDTATEAAQPEPVTETAALPPGSFRIQLAAVRSEDSARATWQELQAKLPELASLQLHIERIDLGSNGIYYRVQGGPLPDKDAASTLCSRLGSRGQDCLVVNP